MPLRGVLAGAAVALLLAALGVAAASADDTTTTVPTTTDVTTTTTVETTTAPPPSTTTVPSTTSTTTTTAKSTTTARATTTRSTTTTTTTTRARAVRHAKHKQARAVRHAKPCLVTAAALLIPGRRPQILRSGGRVSLHRARCVSRAARLRSVSLFGGSVRVARVALGARARASTAGIVVKGTRVARRWRIAIRPWGYVVAARRAAVHVPGGRTAVAGLIVHLVKRHAGLPAGTTLAVAVSGLRLDLRVPRRKLRPAHLPLRVTPPLSRQRFVFPVVGTVAYGDTYGGFRGDVPGNWHHGDDLFAPLGTPVVAVASGTINRVGWETLGGWRLWVRDRAGDQFYYAHLSGYALPRLGRQRVRVGQVLGFVGNTGDAITTPPHLHFEVHPKPLRHLGYDGAVDPTTYLGSWARLRRVRAPRPVHPPLPGEPATRREARSVFHELLAARGLLPHPARPVERPRIVVHPPAAAAARGPAAALRAAAAIRRPSGSGALAVALLAGLGCLGACAAAILVPPVRRRALGVLRER